jgi:hypothetical protein
VWFWNKKEEASRPLCRRYRAVKIIEVVLSQMCYALGALEIELLDILQALSSTPCRTIDISFLRQINK